MDQASVSLVDHECKCKAIDKYIYHAPVRDAGGVAMPSKAEKGPPNSSISHSDISSSCRVGAVLMSEAIRTIKSRDLIEELRLLYPLKSCESTGAPSYAPGASPEN